MVNGAILRLYYTNAVYIIFINCLNQFICISNAPLLDRCVTVYCVKKKKQIQKYPINEPNELLHFAQNAIQMIERDVQSTFYMSAMLCYARDWDKDLFYSFAFIKITMLEYIEFIVLVCECECIWLRARIGKFL